MTAVSADYFDGKSTERRRVTVSEPGPGALRIAGEGIEIHWPLSEVRASARIGDARRYLYFPDGSQCETPDNDGVDRLFASQGAAADRILHRWESNLRYVAGALVLAVVLVWAAITYGIPALAKQAAFALPASTQSVIGRDTLAALDKTLLAPSQLPAARQETLRALFSDATKGLEDGADPRLELRSSRRLGANALALPSGIIIVTDRLVELAANDQEIVAVVAHEIGHLKHRHALRHVLQDSATALVVAAMVGDVTSIASLAAALPTVLLQAKYSRDFEREADEFAADYLKRRGIPTESFSAILLRMEQEKPAARDIPGYLSTHPASRERVQRFGAPR